MGGEGCCGWAACSCCWGPGGTWGSLAPSEAKPCCSKLVGTKGEEGTEKSMVEVHSPGDASAALLCFLKRTQFGETWAISLWIVHFSCR